MSTFLSFSGHAILLLIIVFCIILLLKCNNIKDLSFNFSVKKGIKIKASFYKK